METEAIYNTLLNLQKNIFPYHLISNNDLQTSITSLKRFISENHPKFRLVSDDIRFYHRYAKFTSWVKSHSNSHSTSLIIIVKAPITLTSIQEPLQVYEIIPISLLAPDHQNYKIQLKLSHHFIAFSPENKHYILAKNYGQLHRQSLHREFNFIDVRNTAIRSYNSDIPSCPVVLFTHNLQMIKQYCTYNLIHGQLEPSVQRIHDSLLLFTKVSEITIMRNVYGLHYNSAPTFRQHLVLNDSQYIFQIPCDSAVHALDYIYYGSDKCADLQTSDMDNFTVHYVLNLPILTEYFSNNSLLEDHNFATLLKNPPETRLPILPINKPIYDETIAK